MFDGSSKENIYRIVNNTVKGEKLFLYVFKHNTLADTFNSNIARSKEDILESISEGIIIFTKDFIILKQFKYNNDGQLMEKDSVMEYEKLINFKTKKIFSKIVISWQYEKDKYSYEIDIKNPGAYDFNIDNYNKLKAKDWKL